jgi:lipoyl(octanoyl) transferase
LASVLRVLHLGLTPYEEAWGLQRRLWAEGGSWLILVEHPPVFTLGRNAKASNVIDAGGIPVVRIDRGGDVTYHGPGQLVGYPIVTLRERRIGVREHVERMERAIVAALGEAGVPARRRDGCVGVWANGGKIASIGVRVARGRTTHGFALNACCDLAPFGYVNPCGVPGCAVTSASAELGRRVEVGEVAGRMVEALRRELRFQVINYEIPLGRAGNSG